ncbi:DsbA family oxidoreductase [Klebsiella variicola]
MLRIDIYTELTCPWCFVGLPRLDKVLQERFPELVADIHHHPVLLLPDSSSPNCYASGMV